MNEIYHLRDGFYFYRNVDDSVTIFVTETPLDDSPIFREVTVPENEWASVMSSVCRRGENAKTWQEARDFHNG